VDLKSNVTFVHRFTHLSTDHIVMSWEEPIENLNQQIAAISLKSRLVLAHRQQVHTSVSTACPPLSPGSGGLPTAVVRISPRRVNLRVCRACPMALSSRARSTRASVFLTRRAVVGSS